MRAIDQIISPAGREEWSRGWPLVAGAMVGLIVAHIHVYSLGVIMPSLEKAFGWNRAQISSGLLIVSLVVFPLAPLLGMAIDRYGARPIGFVGLVLYCVSVASLSLAQPDLRIWWMLWGGVALGCLFLNPTLWIAAVSREFEASRGLALSVVLSATGVISLAAPFTTFMLVSNIGWRHAYQVWALGAAIVAFPIFWFCLPRARGRQSRTGRQAWEIAEGFALYDCLRTAAFRRLLTAGPVMAVVFTALIVNAVPILVQGGLGVATGAAVAGVIGLSQAIGRLLTGLLVDRTDPRKIGGIVVLFPALAAGFLLYAGSSVAVAIIAMVLLGLAAGAELDVLGYLGTKHFGLRSFGAAFGIIIGLASLGTGVGPMVASVLYDRTGSYQPVLIGIIPLCLLCSWAFFSLGTYPVWTQNPARTGPGGCTA